MKNSENNEKREHCFKYIVSLSSVTLNLKVKLGLDCNLSCQCMKPG